MDFTLSAYRDYVSLLAENEYSFLTYQQFMGLSSKPKKYCLIRHDVDRKPKNALKMAVLEQELGICSTYYFRMKPRTFNKEIVDKISKLGHEIGYHYESLSDARGDTNEAIKDFEKNLNKLRMVVPVATCSMHGRPLLPYDNRDLWKTEENHNYLVRDLNLLGEIYLDIDYSNIAYINDTGRNWTSGKANKRDRVFSNINIDFKNSFELRNYLLNPTHNEIVFQIHPERWSDNQIEWHIQNLKDMVINTIKKFL
ncbi:MAG: hypothetical protein R2772_11820 [Chitinophagales bacterium]